MRWYGTGVMVLAGLMVVLGVALLVRTALEGGGTFGYVLGALFIAAGTGRLAILRRSRGASRDGGGGSG